jgi:hypothetical protein
LHVRVTDAWLLYGDFGSPQPTPKMPTSIPTADAPSATPAKASPSAPREHGWNLEDKQEADPRPKKRTETSKKRERERAQENGGPIPLSGFPA